MVTSLEEFVYRQNVLAFAKRLRFAKDEAERTILFKLLAEEAARAKAVGWLPGPLLF